MDPLPILVVDDKPDMRTEIARQLNRSGFPVESASNGSEAVDKLRSTKYSLVITEERMPGIRGLDVLHSVREISPQMPVVITTANGTVHTAVEAMRAGASDYLLKPFSFELLEKTVRNTIIRSKRNGQSEKSGRRPDEFKAGREIITRNRKFEEILIQARGIAPSSAAVLIQGESGTGKELLAHYIHRHSLCPEAPYVAINCAALPDTLAESELFGHEKGSFTGAAGRKIGKFELAKQGTVVLDEIGEMPLPLQAKLLRVLQEREIDRIGGSRPVPIEARIIAISNVDLKKAVDDGKFRKDLYYRINVIPLTLPPLRERREDIELLSHHFLKKYSVSNNKNVTGINNTAMEALKHHAWTGNVRELENIMERAVLISSGESVLYEHLLLDSSGSETPALEEFPVKPGCTVRQMEKKLIFQTLDKVNDNRTHAAELLGISIRTLRNKLNEYKDEGTD